ncbi:MAG: cache domain-containing protein, partial [Chloroflexi bacterium]|nr:cache domain-containing protein [Chloroflexota bacterium]
MSKLLRGVTAQLLLLTVLPLTVILAAISFGSIAMHQQAMRRLVSERDIRTVVATAGSIGAMLQHKTDVLDALAATAAREARTGSVIDTLTFDDEMVREFPGGVALYNASGALVETSAVAAGWARAVSSTHILWSSGVQDTRVAVRGDSLVLRAHDRTGVITAVGVLPVSALPFGTLVNPVGEGRTVDAFLFSADGRVLAYTQPDRANSDVSQHPGVAEALQGQRGGLYRPDPATGEEHVVSYAPIVTSRGET